MTGASSAALGFEANLWDAANALRGSMDAAEYKHVVLGLIFLKYISDAFEAHYEKLKAEPYADPEDPDEYRADNILLIGPVIGSLVRTGKEQTSTPDWGVRR